MAINDNEPPENHSPFILDTLKIPASLSHTGENKAEIPTNTNASTGTALELQNISCLYYLHLFIRLLSPITG